MDHIKDVKTCESPAEIRRREYNPYKCIFNSVEAAECLGLSLTAFNKMRKERPFFDADQGDKRAGGFAFWDARHLGLMADVLTGLIDEKMAREVWLQYKQARHLDLLDLCLSLEDKFLRKKREKRLATRRKNELAKQAGGNAGSGEKR